MPQSVIKSYQILLRYGMRFYHSWWLNWNGLGLLFGEFVTITRHGKLAAEAARDAMTKL